MGFYAREPRRLVAQVSADTLVLTSVVLSWLLSRLTERAVLAVAAPARQAAVAAGTVSGQFRSVSEETAKLPSIGNQLRQPFDAAAGSFDDLVGVADDQVRSIERLADLLGWLAFVIPVTVILLLWLPRRVRFYLRSRAAQRYLDSEAALDLLALRTLVSQPVSVLTAINPDPAAAWRSGDATVITRLADVELRRSGLGPRSGTEVRRGPAPAS
ncbi:MAG TPA: hypothetical protein VEQ66_04290 [Propionibacteriaceae bacterium]|nr:hypothetical protein [Propionibacteriaceae bacterium]